MSSYMSSYPSLIKMSVSLLNSSYDEVDIYRLNENYSTTIVVEVKPEYGFKFLYLCDGIGEADDVAYEVRRFIKRGLRYNGSLDKLATDEPIEFEQVSSDQYEITYDDSKCTFSASVRGYYNADYVRDSFAMLLTNVNCTLPF